MVIIQASAAQTASFNGAEFDVSPFAAGRFFLNISAASGTTPTLDVKLQTKDPLSGTWSDLVGAAFAQKTGTGAASLTVYPGIAESANTRVSNALSGPLRVVHTIGGTTPSFTYTLVFVPTYI